MPDVCVIGPVASDVNTMGGRESAPQPGGAAHYSTLVYRALGLDCAVVTKVAAADRGPLLADLEAAGVELFVGTSPATTSFRNDYAADDPDHRTQRVDAVAARITPDDLPPVRARIWQLGPLTERCIDPAVIDHCGRRGGLVGLDLQGLTRRVTDGRVMPAAPRRGIEHFGALDVLKADDAEILAYTGAASIEAAVALVQAAGAHEVIVTHGSRGSTIFGPDGRIEVAAMPPRRQVDPTGCGDTYLAAYLARRLDTADLRECGAFASAVASLKIEREGAFRGNAAEIEARRAGGSG